MPLEVYTPNTRRPGRNSEGLFVSFNHTQGYLSAELWQAAGFHADERVELAVDREARVVVLRRPDGEHDGLRRLYFATKRTSGGLAFSFSKDGREWLGVVIGRRYVATCEDGIVTFRLDGESE